MHRPNCREKAMLGRDNNGKKKKGMLLCCCRDDIVNNGGMGVRVLWPLTCGGGVHAGFLNEKSKVFHSFMRCP
jgi:hypothetical protein